jgi:methylmalonyl-CoA mutase
MTGGPDHKLSLASEFPQATRTQWLKLVEAVLKSRSFEEKLVARTYDGLSVEPLYGRQAEARPIAARMPAAPWRVMARLDHPDPAAANAQALDDVENGATDLSLVFAGSIGARGYGLDASETAMERVLADIPLDAGIAIELDLSPQAKDVPDRLAALVKRRGIDPGSLDIRFGLDPLGAMSAAGGAPLPWSEIAPIFAALIDNLSAQGFRGPFAAADARPVHEAGGSEIQELAFALGNAVAYLRTMESGGIKLEDARRMIFFRLAADTDQFLTMAKFRALRKLWARVEEACRLAQERIFISAETAWRMMTRRDVYANMLRTTIATFSAGLGGANAITILPFTSALGLPDQFARRIARNSQLILLEESNLPKVSDPAAGSGGIEDLTDKLCRAAWSLFQEIETAGGAASALERGLIQKKVAAIRTERERAIAIRRDVLTGTSDFPHLAETPVSVLDVAKAPVISTERKIEFEPLTSSRLAEPYESLRDASDRILQKTGARPQVFLAHLGTPSDFTARATFSKNFFEAGGIEAVGKDTFFNDGQMVEAFKASGAKLACLCSSNAVYAREGAAASKSLAVAGTRHVYLAGRPGKIERELRESGVNTFIHADCDALAILQAAHDMLGHDK